MIERVHYPVRKYHVQNLNGSQHCNSSSVCRFPVQIWRANSIFAMLVVGRANELSLQTGYCVNQMSTEGQSSEAKWLLKSYFKSCHLKCWLWWELFIFAQMFWQGSVEVFSWWVGALVHVYFLDPIQFSKEEVLDWIFNWNMFYNMSLLGNKMFLRIWNEYFYLKDKRCIISPKSDKKQCS